MKVFWGLFEKRAHLVWRPIRTRCFTHIVRTETVSLLLIATYLLESATDSQTNKKPLTSDSYSFPRRDAAREQDPHHQHYFSPPLNQIAVSFPSYGHRTLTLTLIHSHSRHIRKELRTVAFHTSRVGPSSGRNAQNILISPERKFGPGGEDRREGVGGGGTIRAGLKQLIT